MNKPISTANSIDSNVKTLERYSYTDCSGEVAQRVKVCNNVPTFPSGLFNAGLVTEVTLSTASWTALPTTALTDRNAIAIQNTTGFQIKLNYSSGISGYVGIIVENDSERFYNVTDDIVIFAKLEPAASGASDVTVEELS